MSAEVRASRHKPLERLTTYFSPKFPPNHIVMLISAVFVMQELTFCDGDRCHVVTSLGMSPVHGL